MEVIPVLLITTVPGIGIIVGEKLSMVAFCAL